MLKRNDSLPSSSFFFFTLVALFISLSVRATSTSSINANPRSSGGSVGSLNGVDSPIVQNNLTEIEIDHEAVYTGTNITSSTIQPSYPANESSSKLARTSVRSSTIVNLKDAFQPNATKDVVSSSTPFSMSSFSTTETGYENLSKGHSSLAFNTSAATNVLETLSYNPYNRVLKPNDEPAKVSEKVTENNYTKDKYYLSSKLTNDNSSKLTSVEHTSKEVPRESTLSLKTFPTTQSVLSTKFTWLEIVLLNTISKQLKDEIYSYSKVDRSDKEKKYHQLESPLSVITNRSTGTLDSSDNPIFTGNNSIQNASAASYNNQIEQPSVVAENITSVFNQSVAEIQNGTQIPNYVGINNISGTPEVQNVSFSESDGFLELEETARRFNNHSADDAEAVESSLESLSIRNQFTSSSALMIDVVERISPNYLGVTVKSSVYHQPVTDQTNHTIDDARSGLSKDSVMLEIINSSNQTYRIAGSSSIPMSVSNNSSNLSAISVSMSSDSPLYDYVALNPPNEKSTTVSSTTDSKEISIANTTENISSISVITTDELESKGKNEPTQITDTTKTAHSAKNKSFAYLNLTTLIFGNQSTVTGANLSAVKAGTTLKQERLLNFEEELFPLSNRTSTKQQVLSNDIQDFDIKSNVPNDIGTSKGQMVTDISTSKLFLSSVHNNMSTASGYFTTQTQYEVTSTSQRSFSNGESATSSRTTEIENEIPRSTNDSQFLSSKLKNIAIKYGLQAVPTTSSSADVPIMIYNSNTNPSTEKGFSVTTSINDYNTSESANNSKAPYLAAEKSFSQIDIPEMIATSPTDNSDGNPFRSGVSVQPTERKSFLNSIPTHRTFTESTPLHEVTTEGRIFFNLCFTKKPFFNSLIKSPTPKEIIVSKSAANTKVFWNLCPTKKPNPDSEPSSTLVVPISTINGSSSTVEADEEFSTTETADTISTDPDEETTQSFQDQQENYPVYWNVPTFQCHKYGLNFGSVREWGLRQNHQDQFRGEEIAILYDPGDFPALLGASAGRKEPRNGGVPQEGSLSRHLSLFQSHLEKLIPDVNFTGLAIIDFEHWRPVWRQNWGSLSPYRDFSRLIERRKHPFWFSSMIEVEATYRYELGARVFLLDTLRAGKRLRPKASWGYYGYPFCFNYTPHNNRATCSYEVQMDNDSMDWLFSETTAYYPSLYLKSKDMYPTKRQRFIKGRLDEAMRLSRTVPVYPYVWYKYHDTNQFLSKEDMKSVLKIPMDRGCKGAVIWGASRDVNSREKCQALQAYLDEVIGPAVKEIHDEFYKTRGEENLEESNLDEVEDPEEVDEEDKEEKKRNYDIRDFEV